MDNLLPLAAQGKDFKRPVIIAGPCSAETPEQVLTTAQELAAHGVGIFRAGIWKPRTKPGGFEGIGEPALEWLKEVKHSTGMLIAVEVATHAHVEAALRHEVDILWIGARTTGNPFAVQEIADSLRHTPEIPVLVKNPMNPDIELWTGAMERLHNAGIRRIGAIHRGFSVYGERMYRNQPQWRIPLELKVRFPNLPIICDPSHMGGKRELVAPLSQQALDMGFDGLIIETHCNPDHAWSDKNQQITPGMLALILDSLELRDAHIPTGALDELRRQIDQIDNELIDVLARRMAVSREIGRYKRNLKMPVVQAGRYGTVMESRIKAGAALGMGGEFMKTLLSAIHEESVRQQVELHDEPEE